MGEKELELEYTYVHTYTYTFIAYSWANPKATGVETAGKNVTKSTKQTNGWQTNMHVYFFYYTSKNDTNSYD